MPVRVVVPVTDGRGSETMTQHLRRTLRSFLRSERPATREVAREVLDEWFGRYRPDPGMLDQEIERHFSNVPPSRNASGESRRSLER